MVKSTYFQLIFLFTVFVAGTISAQVAEELVDARIQILIHNKLPALGLGPGEEIPPEYRQQDVDLYYWTEDGYEPIRISRNRLTNRFRYSGPPNFALYERIPAVSEEEEDTYNPRMVASLTPGHDTYYLIGHASQQQDGMLRLIPVPIDPERLPPGRVLALNLGNRSIELAVGADRQRVRVEAFRGAIVNISRRDEGHLQVLAAVGSTNEDYTLVYRRMWRLRPDARAVSIFFPVNDNQWNSEHFVLE